MLPRISVLVLGGLVVWFAGCGTKSAEHPSAKVTSGVGVVDLDLVAKRLGRDIEINNLVQKEANSLGSELTTLQEALNHTYDEKRAKLGDEPTDEQTKELVAWRNRTNANLLQRKRDADAKVAAYRQQLIDQFREQARPIAREIAAARGLGILLPKNLIWTIDPAVEITDEVAAKMQASPAADAGSSESAPAVSKKPIAETSSR